MKYLLIITIAFIVGAALGDILKVNDSHQQEIGQPKSVSVSKTRYFFVGYSIGEKADGNIEWQINDGGLPNKKELYAFVKKSCPEIDFSYNEFIIVGIHEFKSKIECSQFFNNQKSNEDANSTGLYYR